jgi:HEAT repeat protein
MRRRLQNLMWVVALTALSAAVAEQAALIEVLHSDAGRWEKVAACRQLARVGGVEAVPALAGLLADSELAHMARYALEAIPYPEVDQALRAALEDLDGLLLAGVVQSLGTRRDREAVRPLAGLLGHADPVVAEAAARSLGRIGSVAAVEALGAAWSEAPVEQRPMLDDALLHAASVRLTDGDGPGAVRVYDRLRASTDPAVRAAALRGAILARGEAGIPMLRAAVAVEDVHDFTVALHTALELPGTATTEALTQVVDELPVDRRPLVIQALGLRADPSATPALEAWAIEGATPVRVAAIRSLVQLAAVDALEVLRGLIADNDPAVAEAARTAVAVLPGREVDELVVSLLDDADAGRRRLAVEWVGQRRLVAALPNLLAIAAGDEPTLHGPALRVLGELAGPAEMAGMIRLLEHTGQPQDVVRTLMAAYTRQPAEVQETMRAAIVKAFPERPAGIQIVLLPLLRALGGPAALAAVQRAAEGGAPALREAAVRTLCEWPTPDAVPDLAERLRSEQDQTLRVLALRGYLRLVQAAEAPADEKADALVYGLQQAERAEEQKMVMGALGGLPDLTALEHLTAYFDHEEVGLDAARAAVRIAAALAPPRPARVEAVLQTIARQFADPELVAAAQGLLDP